MFTLDIWKMQVSRREAIALPFLAICSASSLAARSAQSLGDELLVPEHFGATAYATPQTAAQGLDATDAVQTMADEAARHGKPCGGTPGRWYKTGTVNWPSGSEVVGLQLVARASDEDVSPFTIDARLAPRRNLLFTDCAVDGNRVDQHRLATSGGDGQRCGWRLSGGFAEAIVGVTLTRCRAWYCATDGFFTWCNGIIQGRDDRHFFRNIRIIEPDFQWNGRHGGSLMSVGEFWMTGGKLKNNGKDLPDLRERPQSNGSWARAVRTSDGRRALYGRPWDCESSLPVEFYTDIRFEGVDMRDNIGGLLFHHNFYDDRRRVRGVQVIRCLLSDPEGQTTGDGSLIFFAVDGRTGRPLEEGRIAFEDIRALDNRYDRHGIAVYSADRVVVQGGWADMTGPGYWGFYAKLMQCGENTTVDVPSNRYRVWLSSGQRESVVAGRFIRSAKRSSSAS